MAFTNCLANLTGLLAPIVAGYIIEGRVSYLLYISTICLSICLHIMLDVYKDILSYTPGSILILFFFNSPHKHNGRKYSTSPEGFTSSAPHSTTCSRQAGDRTGTTLPMTRPTRRRPPTRRPSSRRRRPPRTRTRRKPRTKLKSSEPTAKTIFNPKSKQF